MWQRGRKKKKEHSLRRISTAFLHYYNSSNENNLHSMVVERHSLRCGFDSNSFNAHDHCKCDIRFIFYSYTSERSMAAPQMASN